MTDAEAIATFEAIKPNKKDLEKTFMAISQQRSFDEIEHKLEKIVALLETVAEKSSQVAEKSSHSEYRECYETSELPAVTRFAHQWLAGEALEGI